MGGKSTLRTRQKALDSIFSEWVRRSAANEHGLVSCVTCGRKMYWLDAEAGHWVKRQHKLVTWDERNVHVQCTRCNKWRGGAEEDHEAYIVAKYGREVADELEQARGRVFKVNKDWVEERIAYYKQKLTELETKA